MAFVPNPRTKTASLVVAKACKDYIVENREDLRVDVQEAIRLFRSGAADEAIAGSAKKFKKHARRAALHMIVH